MSIISQENAPTEIPRGQDKEGKASTEGLTVFPGASSLHQIDKDQPALYSKVPTAHLRRVSPSKFTLDSHVKNFKMAKLFRITYLSTVYQLTICMVRRHNFKTCNSFK